MSMESAHKDSETMCVCLCVYEGMYVYKKKYHMLTKVAFI